LDFRRLGNILIIAGAVVLAAAVLWWFSFYSALVDDLRRASGGQADAGLRDAIGCLYASSGICSFVSGVASLAGRTPYEPMVFWFGLGGLVLGVVIRLAAVRPTSSS
jgi:hypothetical protein